MCRHKTEGRYTTVKRKASNGHWQVYKRCDVCGQMLDGGFLPHSDGWEDLPEAQALSGPTCEYYGCSSPAEYHHFMPQAIAAKANEIADYWPGAMLCRKHHERWHAILTPGLMSNLKPTEDEAW